MKYIRNFLEKKLIEEKVRFDDNPELGNIPHPPKRQHFWKQIILYLIAIILIGILFMIPCSAQDNIEEITYGIVFETTESHLYKPSNLEELPRYFIGGSLLEIGEKYIKTSEFGRFEYFIYTSKWEKEVLSSGHETIRVYFRDVGGSIGYMNMLYKEKSDEYVLIITYETEDQLWVHYMKPTKNRLYVHPDGRPSHEMRDYNKYPYNMMEVQEFFDNYGKFIFLDFNSLEWL